MFFPEGVEVRRRTALGSLESVGAIACIISYRFCIKQNSSMHTQLAVKPLRESAVEGKETTLEPFENLIESKLC